MCHDHDHYEPIEDWILFPHDKTKPCSVLVFNFGNELYEDLENTRKRGGRASQGIIKR